MQRKTLSELCAERKALRLRQKELETRKRAIPRITEDPTVEVDSRMSILYANGFRASVAQRLLRSLYMAERNSRQRGIDFNLSDFELITLARRSQGRCELTGIRFELVETNRKWDRQPWAASIDRIDCAKGYAFDNCRLVCAAVNVALNSWGETVLERIAEGLVSQKLRQDLGYMNKLRKVHNKIQRRNKYLRTRPQG